ncbi:MAG: TetR/AcrR family transcriptional regulator [Bordetella sp.]|uniref:TetR/AcrR family transcriptional regulator n=1 Tax=Bordetella sp. TaxID=28081 RepID=UPI003F7CC657
MDAALDGAVRIFRERGYHATALADLGPAMGLSAGSIYKAFADKRAVFAAALDRYIDMRNSALRRLTDAQPTGRDKIRAVLRFYAESAHGIEGRRGCLVVGCATELSTFDAEIAQRVVATLQTIETTLLAMVKLGQADGSVAAALDPAAVAGVLLGVIQGFRILGKTGRSRARMMAAADQALHLLD